VKEKKKKNSWEITSKEPKGNAGANGGIRKEQMQLVQFRGPDLKPKLKGDTPDTKNMQKKQSKNEKRTGGLIQGENFHLEGERAPSPT